MNVTAEQLEKVRQWAAEGIDLNGIQKNLAAECGVHMRYMEVRFLLLDNGIEIGTPAPAEKPQPAPQPEAPAPAPQQAAMTPPAASAAGKPSVTIDELTIPGTLLSGKVSFPSGTTGAWQIDQMGRFAWSELNGTPTQEELQAFQMELTMMLQRR